MRFSLITLGLGLAATANAAFVKRSISAAVQKCIDDLNAIDPQVVDLTNQVNAFTSSAGYAGAFAIHSSEQSFESLLNTATTDCCAVASATEEEATAVLAVVDGLVTDIEAALAAVGAKKPEFDAVLLATALVKTDIKNLDTKTTALDTCLYNACPDDLKPTAQGYIDRINNAFDAVEATYGI